MAQVKERGGGWLSFHFSRGQNRKSRSSVIFCSETKRKRLLRRLAFVLITMEPFRHRMNYRTDHIKHEVYINCFLQQPFAHKESFPNDGIDCFSYACEQITITGSNFLDGCVAKGKHFFTSCERAYNDFMGYWEECFCSSVHYFKFWKSHPWLEIQDYNFV